MKIMSAFCRRALCLAICVFCLSAFCACDNNQKDLKKIVFSVEEKSESVTIDDRETVSQVVDLLKGTEFTESVSDSETSETVYDGFESLDIWFYYTDDSYEFIRFISGQSVICEYDNKTYTPEDGKNLFGQLEDISGIAG